MGKRVVRRVSASAIGELLAAADQAVLLESGLVAVTVGGSDQAILIEAPAGVAEQTWQEQRDALPTNLVLSRGQTGVSPDFDLIKTVMTSQNQSILDTAGVQTFGFQPGHDYWGYQVDYIWESIPVSSTQDIGIGNSLFRGPSTFSGGAVGVFGKYYVTAHALIRLTDCGGVPRDPKPYLNALHGDGFSARRCEIAKAQDGASIFSRRINGNKNADLECGIRQCWFGEFAWFSQAEAAALGQPVNDADGTHNDGFQLQGGANFYFEYNNMNLYSHPDYPIIGAEPNADGSNRINAGAMIKPDDGLITGMVVRGNRWSGGRSHINFNHDAPDRYIGNVGLYQQNLHELDVYNTNYILDPPALGTFVCDFGSHPSTSNKHPNGSQVAVK